MHKPPRGPVPLRRLLVAGKMARARAGSYLYDLFKWREAASPERPSPPPLPGMERTGKAARKAELARRATARVPWRGCDGDSGETGRSLGEANKRSSRWSVMIMLGVRAREKETRKELRHDSYWAGSITARGRTRPEGDLRLPTSVITPGPVVPCFLAIIVLIRA